MANAVPQIKPVISTVTIAAQAEGEMDALLLGRTRVSLLEMYVCFCCLRRAVKRIVYYYQWISISQTTLHVNIEA